MQSHITNSYIHYRHITDLRQSNEINSDNKYWTPPGQSDLCATASEMLMSVDQMDAAVQSQAVSQT